jgi:O-antigen/teichoic acid export membrane protein
VHPRKFIRDSMGMAFSQYFVRLLLMARGVVAARLLGPVAFGAWNGLTLILDYGVLATLGTQQGLDQVVPGRIVEADAQRLDRVKRAGLANVLLFSVLFGAIALVYFGRPDGKLRDAWGIGGIGVILLCATLTCLAFYHLTLLRSHGNIGSVSIWTLIQGSVGALLGLALVPWIGAWGLLIGWLIGTVASLIYVRIQARGIVPVIPRLSSDSGHLVAIGFPMFLFTVSNLAMRTLDRLVILKLIGTEALGYYSLGVMAIALMLYLPDSVSYVLYPRLLSRYRESNHDPESIREPFERTMLAVSLLIPMLCGLAFMAADDLVAWLLPKYQAGLVPLKVLGFGALGLALANLSSIGLMTLGRQLFLIPASFLMIGLGAALDVFAVRQGYGIQGVAWATIVAYGIDGAVLLWLFTGGLRLPFGRRTRLIARAFAPLAIAIGLVLLLDRVLPWPDAVAGKRAILRLLMGVPLFLGLYLFLTRPLMSGLGLKQLLMEFNLPRLPGLRRRSPASDSTTTSVAQKAGQ